MEKIKLFCLLVLVLSASGCNKTEDPVQIADNVTGIYNGTMSFGGNQLYCTTEIKKNEASKVTLSISMNGSNYLFGNISVQQSGNNTFTLSYTEPGGFLNGTVTGKNLTYSVYSGLLSSMFTGTR